MVTRIYKHRKGRYFPKEHREAKKLTAAALAERLEIHEKSVYRVEKEPWRLDRKQKRDEWAAALGLDSGEELERPPGQPKPANRPSIDDVTKNQTDEFHKMAYDIVARLVSGGRSQ